MLTGIGRGHLFSRTPEEVHDRPIAVPRAAVACCRRLAWRRPPPRSRAGRSFAQAGGTPLRLVCWPMMNGADGRAFLPGQHGGDERHHEPIKAYARYATFIRGINVSGSVNHYAVRSIYSGSRSATTSRPIPSVKSVDQLIADQSAAHRADAVEVAAPGGHPGGLDQLLQAGGTLDPLLRAHSGRLRGQPGHRVRSGVRRRRGAPRRAGRRARRTSPPIRSTCSRPR